MQTLPPAADATQMSGAGRSPAPSLRGPPAGWNAPKPTGFEWLRMEAPAVDSPSQASGPQGSPVVLVQSGTSVKSGESQGIWWDELDRAMLPRSMERAARAEGRRRVARAGRREGAARYWRHRRDSAAAPLSARVALCGKGEPMVLACGCGHREVIPVCGQTKACPRCQRRAYKRLQTRLTRTLRARQTSNYRRWLQDGRPRGARRTAALVTLTVAHSGELAADREVLQRAWERLRAWLWHRCGGAFDFVRVWEMTPGSSGDGHVHCHVVAMLPWVDYRDLGAEWVRATSALAVSGGVDVRRISPVEASSYLAKYASKGVQVGVMAPALAADFLHLTYGKHAVSVSRGFWVPREKGCHCCGERLALIERGSALVSVSPALGMDIQRRRAMWARYGPPERWPDWAPESRRHWQARPLPL